MPVFLIMVFAVAEAGLMLRDFAAMRGAGIEAIRTAAIVGDDSEADYEIIQVINDSASALPPGSLLGVVIFKADGPAGEVPSACVNSIPGVVVEPNSQPAVCNTYLPVDLLAPIDRFGCDQASDLDNTWCPTSRAVAQTVANGGPPDWIGIHLEVRRDMLTGFFGTTQSLSSTKILRLEPRGI